MTSTMSWQERLARDRLPAIGLARAANAKSDARRGAAAIWERIARPLARQCCWAITAASTLEDLLALGAGCTVGRWACPAIRRPGR